MFTGFATNSSLSARSVSSSARRVCLLAAAAAGTMALATANVHAAETAPQATVSYHDLDLSKEQDANELYARLRRAAKRVCGDNGVRGLDRASQERACYEQALDAAVADIDHAKLTTVHAADNKLRLAQRKELDADES